VSELFELADETLRALLERATLVEVFSLSTLKQGWATFVPTISGTRSSRC
jgi:hypothetical protein